MLNEGAKLGLVAGDIIRHQNSAGDQVRDDRFVTGHVSVLIGIQKAKGDVSKIFNLLPGIALDLMNEVFDTGDAKRLTRERDLLRKNFKCDQLVSGNLTGKGQPQSRITSAGPDLETIAGGRRRNEDGQQASNFRRNLFEALGQRRAISSVADIGVLEKFHSPQGWFRDVVKHGVSGISCGESVTTFLKIIGFGL